MKKIQIILTAMIALITISGTLAFKAHKKTKNPFFYYDSVQNKCIIPVDIFFTTGGPTTTILLHFSSATISGDCYIGVRETL